MGRKICHGLVQETKITVIFKNNDQRDTMYILLKNIFTLSNFQEYPNLETQNQLKKYALHASLVLESRKQHFL